ADAGLVFRIHKFLEEWGLINYHVDPGSIPEFEPPLVDYTHVDTPFGVKKALQPVSTDTSMRATDSELIATKDKDKDKDKEKEAAGSIDQKKKFNSWEAMRCRENMFAAAAAEYDTISTNVETQCVFCALDCTYSRFRSNVDKAIILCAEWYSF
ncbi:SWI/SNF complex protein, partial [Reticulomyxa filosa]